MCGSEIRQQKKELGWEQGAMELESINTGRKTSKQRPQEGSLEFIGADKYSWGPSRQCSLWGEGLPDRDRMGGLSIMLDRAWVPGSLQELPG